MSVKDKFISMREIVLGLLCCTAIMASQPLQALPIDYQRQVQPLFDRYCVECHSGWFPQGGLRLDSLENLREGGRNGAVLFAGDADKGKLVNMIRIVPGRFTIMPPGPAAVAKPEFELIQRWIEQGAQ